ncbi:hypothetical protein AKJ16_DCAP15870 [Drosera capensis]
MWYPKFLQLVVHVHIGTTRIRLASSPIQWQSYRLQQKNSDLLQLLASLTPSSAPEVILLMELAMHVPRFVYPTTGLISRYGYWILVMELFVYGT